VPGTSPGCSSACRNWSGGGSGCTWRSEGAAEHRLLSAARGLRQVQVALRAVEEREEAVVV